MLVDRSNISPKRNMEMVEMEVESVVMQALPNGYLVSPGKSTIIVYKDEVAQVEDLVRSSEDIAAIERAKTECALRLRQYADDKCGGDMAAASKLFPESVESVFVSQNKGSNFPHIKPLLSARKIKEGLPPPAETDRWNAQLHGGTRGRGDFDAAREE